MDGRLYNDVLAFTECIKDTPEYRDYQEKKKKIAEMPELKEKAELLKQRNFELLSRFDDSNSNVEDVMRFADEFEDIFMEPAINEYLSAEAAFCKMLREVLNMAMEEIDF